MPPSAPAPCWHSEAFEQGPGAGVDSDEQRRGGAEGQAGPRRCARICLYPPCAQAQPVAACSRTRAWGGSVGHLDGLGWSSMGWDTAGGHEAGKVTFRSSLCHAHHRVHGGCRSAAGGPFPSRQRTAEPRRQPGDAAAAAGCGPQGHLQKNRSDASCLRLRQPRNARGSYCRLPSGSRWLLAAHGPERVGGGGGADGKEHRRRAQLHGGCGRPGH
mmetsp:Transcript_49886/g.156136  ORF Transcript_49886/g.156136 Transcript_49886/m.156136 type:complete len:215 (-) Transcript_49886:2260-2904(-)